MFHIEDGLIEQTPQGLLLTGNQDTIQLNAPHCRIFLLSREEGGLFVLPVDDKLKSWDGCDRVWILPLEVEGAEAAYCIQAPGAGIAIRKQRGGYAVTIACRRCDAVAHENRPRCDFFGAPYGFDIPNGDALARTLAAFYWDSILPMVKEKTSARKQRFSSGFVVSTLQKGAYAGTYPDVDHEFQIKGRVALGGPLELDIVRRMMELQIDVMKKDPTGQWRNPCAIQPRGNREYHVPRDSMDHSNNAIMFLVTGNIEIVESAWLYYCRTKDMAWIAAHIEDFERAIALVERYIDDGGRLWSDVYYEDQVIKDGRETIAQAFAANAYGLLARLEDTLGRGEQGDKYRQLAQTLAQTLVQPLPEGYWDAGNRRFADWVGRDGSVHDHIHLLANELPLLFGYATAEQTQAVQAILAQHADVFWKFPSFVAAKIEDYTDDEIGDGGPYDLCAAGRYWCWDAGYWHAQGDGAKLRAQLDAVAAQAQADGYIMGERYDMNYVYYQSELNWHGAAHYYEYPNVFAWVLLREYLGIMPQPDCDYLLRPRLADFGSVRFGELGYNAQAESFAITNHGGSDLQVRMDLAGVYPRAGFSFAGRQITVEDLVTVGPGETVTVAVARA